MNTNSKIYIAGHTGMMGSAIHRNLVSKGYSNIIARPIEEFDLICQQAVKEFFEKEKPEYVFLAAARVGGIIANSTLRAQFIYENIQIQSNIIHYSYLNGVKKLLFLGSSCIYPKNAPQPMKEEYLLSGELEYSNEPYAVAKISGLKMCESYNIQYGTNFISVMPTNLYGYNDNYNLETSHVLPAFIRKFHLGKCLENNDWNSIKKDLNKRPVDGLDGNADPDVILKILNKYGIGRSTSIRHPSPVVRHQRCIEPVEMSSVVNQPVVTINLWGTGNPRREFLHADDAADACVYLMENVDFKDIIERQTTDYNHPSSVIRHPSSVIRHPSSVIRHPSSVIRNTHINIGSGQELTIKELAELIKSAVGFKGEIHWDYTKPDGTFKKLLDIEKLSNLGWKHKISLKEGIEKVYINYCE
ncbi:MAG: GDP-L-fucose synthase [Bacteroidia bacterium]|nr:GDP-L-fucose synthase [Bacteroidia bacterium]